MKHALALALLAGGLAGGLAGCAPTALAFTCEPSSDGQALILDDGAGGLTIATCDGKAGVWELARCTSSGDDCRATSTP